MRLPYLHLCHYLDLTLQLDLYSHRTSTPPRPASTSVSTFSVIATYNFTPTSTPL